MKVLEKLLAPFQVAFKHSLESFIRLETIDDEKTIVAKDGSMLSYLKIDGSKQVIGETEYNFLVEVSTIKVWCPF